ncbi:hypothetical protein C8Q76DRAFT_787036 [Earliella scabrosa]|nr:hypothetical protein C8Q76DRAFT_787036 [Earliella scabrosa]
MSISTGDIVHLLLNPHDSVTCQALRAQAETAWQCELHRKIHICKENCYEFLMKYVPSSTSYPLTHDIPGDIFADWKPIPGKEPEGYPSLLKGLNILVSGFGADKRPVFFDCHKYQQQFPFSAFAKKHSTTNISLGVTFPGKTLASLPESPDWSHMSMILEVKATREDDPFNMTGPTQCNTLLQLAINARCLMHAHGLLAGFVIVVYGDVFRIIRFDHSAAVACERLYLRNPAHLKILQHFLWNFVNPCEGGLTVGCDPTIRRLTDNDEAWLKERLTRIGAKADDLVMAEARWAEVHDDDGTGQEEHKAYIMLKALDVNGRLFSRATTVWLAVRDTRQWINRGHLVDDPQPADLKLRIIKEAWHQLARRSERDFYDRLAVIPEEEKFGLPSLLGGGDLGEREARQWEHALYGASTPRSALTSDVHKTRLSESSATTHGPIPRLLSTTTSTPNAPVRRPMHQTFTWRLARGPDHWHHERSHMRFVVDVVGRPLTQFHSTKELVTAMRDAIKGHRLAMTRAGVLHRDVSMGNILIVGDYDLDSKPRFEGFVHDFDYSSMSRDIPDAQLTNMSAAELAQRLVAEADAGTLMNRTGTYFFLARGLLTSRRTSHTIRHDLESFYWVLLWVVLRHVAYDSPHGKKLYAIIFPDNNQSAAAGAKESWLDSDVFDFSIKGNAPLTDLIREVAEMLENATKHLNGINYDTFLAPFEIALQRNDWPDNDAALPYVLSELRTNTMERLERRVGRQ